MSKIYTGCFTEQDISDIFTGLQCASVEGQLDEDDCDRVRSALNKFVTVNDKGQTISYEEEV